jgi:hypothetical protein
VRLRPVVLAAAGGLALLLGVWVLDWWAMQAPHGSVHATLRSVEACSTALGKCQSWSLGGPLTTALLVAGTLLALATLALGALRWNGATVSPRLVRTQVMLALLTLAGAVIQMAMTPGKLTGADPTYGAWVTIAGIVLAGVSGIAAMLGADEFGAGAFYEPVKVDVPADVMETNAKVAGATIPPFAIAARGGNTLPPAAAAWQPSIKEIVHTEPEAPRRRSTRAPYTAPPTFDAARQALRFVVAEAAIGDDGLAVTLEDHRKLVVPWKQLTAAAARQLPPGPPFDKLIVIDLVTLGGAPLRFLPSTRVNYADLPGGAAPGSRENLRRLVAHVRTLQPTFGVEHDSAAFFAGGREPPALTSLKQFMTYDEQYSGVIGANT